MTIDVIKPEKQVAMSNISGVFTNGAETYGRFLEVFIDGHWWVVGDALENVGKTTKRLLVNAYPFIYGGASSIIFLQRIFTEGSWICQTDKGC